MLRRHTFLAAIALACMGVQCRSIPDAAAEQSLSLPRSQQSIRITAIASVPKTETVFAYSRISPDGRYLAYTSERIASSGIPVRRVRVLDVRTGRIEFQEEGLDAYWSPDGSRLIYLSLLDPFSRDVAILDWRSRQVTRNVAPVALGDYFSWATNGGRDLIGTIKGNYFYLADNRAVLPARRSPYCERLGDPEDRPLLSKDGRRVTAFVQGYLVVRNVDSCDDIILTGMRGAKADFSYDGTKIAFHRPTQSAGEFQVVIVDLKRMTIAELPLSGSAYYPSWTASGALSFRYESGDWNGFVLASNLDSLPQRTIQYAMKPEADRVVNWHEVFETTDGTDGAGWRVVVIWAPWNPHSADAIRAVADLERSSSPKRRGRIGLYESAVPGPHVDEMRRRIGAKLPTISVRSAAWAATWAHAQIPVVLVFHEGRLVTHLLGAPSAAELAAAISEQH